MEKSIKLSPYKVYWVELIPSKGIVTKHDRRLFGEYCIKGKESKHYKHFPSKQAIFDEIVEASRKKYLAQCSQVTARIRGSEEMKRYCLEMFEYQTGNEWIVMFRQLLLHEKFHDEKMAEIYKMFFVDIPINNQMAIFDTLQKQGLMIAGDTKVYAMELYAPFYLYHFVEHDKEALRELYERHVEYFFDTHFLKGKNE